MPVGGHLEGRQERSGAVGERHIVALEQLRIARLVLGVGEQKDHDELGSVRITCALHFEEQLLRHRSAL